MPGSMSTTPATSSTAGSRFIRSWRSSPMTCLSWWTRCAWRSTGWG
jgi:hypothetical protein